MAFLASCATTLRHGSAEASRPPETVPTTATTTTTTTVRRPRPRCADDHDPNYNSLQRSDPSYNGDVLAMTQDVCNDYPNAPLCLNG